MTPARPRSPAYGALRALSAGILVLGALAAPARASTPARVLFWANVEGASHTTANGNDPARASGATRIRTIVAIIERRRVDVGALSEFERPQRVEFQHLAGRTFALVYPGRDSRDSVFYRRSTYRLTRKTSLRVPYFGGHLWRIPIAHLVDRSTGKRLTVIAVHNPAYPRNARWRVEALRREIRAVWHTRGPVIIAGDWNARRSVRRAWLHRTHLDPAAPAGRPVRIDQAFGRELTWSSYRRLTSPAITRATDHRAVYVATFR